MELSSLVNLTKLKLNIIRIHIYVHLFLLRPFSNIPTKYKGE